MIVHKYRLCKTSWGIAINIYGNVFDYDRYNSKVYVMENNHLTKICEGLYVLFDKEQNRNVGPNHSYNQMQVDDYSYMIEGLLKVSGKIKENTEYQNTLIVITRLEFSLCDFQEEGLIAGMMEWAAKAFDFTCPHIEVKYQKDINKYLYEL
ncbi:MAG: hypothetical protein J6C19_10465 [Lachnospiraceae bacterium]|nr:hypothetical protein [Lachnospiraceae bacterium]